MKQMKYRFLSITLIIIIISVSSFSVPVYASHGGGAGVNHDPAAWIMKDSNTINVEDEGKLIYYIEFLLSQIGAVINDHDISKVMANDQTMKSYIAKGYYDENEDTIVFPQETVTYVYNYIQNHYNEWLPFQIQQTYNYKSIPASLFPSKQTYSTFLSYCQSHYMVAFSFPAQVSYTNTSMHLGDVSEVVDDGGGFVYGNNTSFYAVNADWSNATVWCDYYPFVKNDHGEYILGTIREKQQGCTAFYNYDSTAAQFRTISTIRFLITKDGGRIRVFNSLAEFKDYNAGQRKVFFGKGFYDFDPSEISVKWDEFIDKIGRMDDLLQDLIDKITDNPNISEEDLEKLIDELLGKIGEIGGDISSGIDETNSLLGGIASSLSGYFESVLSALSELAVMIEEGFMTLAEQLDMMIYELGLIYESMGDMTEEEVSEKTDSLLSQLFSAFSEIGDVLKGKFPFCLPNDLYTMLALLAGNEVSVSPGAGGGGGGDGNGDIMICAYGSGNEDSKAPVFEIPFVIGSADIEEKIIIDLSPFEYISKLSRTLMTLYYCACLMQLTLKVIDLGKDLGDD